MTSLRAELKHTIEAILTGGTPLMRRVRAGQSIVLAYHDIVPTGASLGGDRSLHLPQRSFAEQLDSLADTHDIVPLADLVTRLGNNPAARGSRRPRVAITFDDAYNGAITAGIDELEQRNLPATVFVSPGLLDGREFWWDTNSDPDAGLDPAFRERALSDGRGLGEEVAALVSSSEARETMPEHARGASFDLLRDAVRRNSITVAAHTWNHPNLNALPDDCLMSELRKPLEWLQQFGERALPYISYPYGLADARVQAAAREVGYRAGFMINGGWITSSADSFAIPRLNVPAGVSRNGFILRTSGLLSS